MTKLPANKSNAPFFKTLQQEVDRVFDDFRNLNPWDSEAFFGSSNGGLTLKLDVSETDKEVEVSTELPGVKMNDIEVSATDNLLTIKGEKSVQSDKDEKDYHLSERHYGSFLRTIPLGFEIDSDRVNASFSDGVLTITITKPPEVTAKTKKIKISNAT